MLEESSGIKGMIDLGRCPVFEGKELKYVVMKAVRRTQALLSPLCPVSHSFSSSVHLFQVLMFLKWALKGTSALDHKLS